MTRATEPTNPLLNPLTEPAVGGSWGLDESLVTGRSGRAVIEWWWPAGCSCFRAANSGRVDHRSEFAVIRRRPPSQSRYAP